MIFRFKCGHTTHGKMWKDGLIVPMHELCPDCKRVKRVQPAFRTFVMGSKRLILKLVVRK